MNLNLTRGQAQAVDMVGRAVADPRPKVCVIAGFAGTGKTTMLRVIADRFGTPMVVTPTGKASLRVKEATGLDAQTIHRWIYKPEEDPETGTTRFSRRTLDEVFIPASRLVLLDEASMVGPDVWKDVHQTCVELELNLVLVGDPFQLAPVQPPGSPPFSVMTPEFANSVGAERVELTEILRQAADSPIIRASMRLRNGERLRALEELPKVPYDQFWRWSYDCYGSDGVIICHKNTTRRDINIGMRTCFGITSDEPQPGEPLLVLRNNYDIGLFNGEVVNFRDWIHRPTDQFERIHDKWQNISENVRLGAARLGTGLAGVLALEQLRGSLVSGMSAIAYTSKRWAKREEIYVKDAVVPHLHANFGYCCTAHKGQGSQWPYALVVLEPSIRLDEEEGRRWAYTAITRSQKVVAICVGSLG